MEPEVSESSLKQVPDHEDFVVGLLLAVHLQPAGYTSTGAQAITDQAQAPRAGQTGLRPQASGLSKFHTACLEV